MEQKNIQNCYGLTIIRLGIGILFVIFGTTKLIGGPDLWASLGAAMSHLGITFVPVFWGLCASLAELSGGLLLVLNRSVHWATLGISSVMIVALIMQINTGKPFTTYSHCITMLIIMAGLFITRSNESK